MARVKAAKKKRDLAAEIDALTAEMAKVQALLEEGRRIAAEKRLGEARWLTIEEISAITGVSVTSLRRMKARNQLRHHRLGNVVAFSPEDLDWMKKTFAVLEGKRGEGA